MQTMGFFAADATSRSQSVSSVHSNADATQPSSSASSIRWPSFSSKSSKPSKTSNEEKIKRQQRKLADWRAYGLSSRALAQSCAMR